MYSATIKTKVDMMFIDLRKQVAEIVFQLSTSQEVVPAVTKLVSSELSTRSKSILSDMLFDLFDNLMETDFFSDISKQNKFYEINLRQEILNKYQFSPSENISYKEVSEQIQALKVGGVVFVAGGAIEVGAVLVAGLSLSSLIPVPISLLIVVSIGAAVADCYAIEPSRNKKSLAQALDNYLVQVKEQFLGWFDEVEIFFNKRVEEIMQTI